MKIVIVSDTHGDLSALRRVVLIEKDAALWLHAGDVEASSGDIWPFQAVKGNCDGAFSEYPFRKVYDTPFGKLQIEHYPIYGSAMMQALHMDGIRIFVHGHTHVREDETVEGVRVYCPGSLCLPEDNPTGTYLVLTVTDKIVDGVFKEIEQ
jgi:putative phosphoesterase